MRVLCLLLFLLCVVSFPAWPATVSGNISDAQGNALGDVTVSFYVDFPFVDLGSARTNSAGEYTFTTTRTGPASAQASGTGLLTVRQALELPAGNAPLRLDFVMAPPGRISGTIRSAPDAQHPAGAPIPGAYVRLVGSENRETTAAADGSYAFNDLPAGSYGVCVATGDDAYIDECWGGTIPDDYNYIRNFIPVVLAGGEQRSGINLELDVGATLSGILRNRVSQELIRDFQALMFIQDTLRGERYISVQTNAEGRYWIAGLAPSIYHVQLFSAGIPYYTGQAFPNIDCIGTSCSGPVGAAIQITDPISSRNDVDFNLHPGGAISGRVTDANTGSAVAGATVDLYSVTLLSYLTWNGRVFTAPDGTYRISHAPTVDLMLLVSSPDHRQQRYPGIECLANCLNWAPGILVPANGAVTGIDFALNRGVVIRGNAHRPGYFSDRATVQLLDASGVQIANTLSDLRGGYRLPAMYPGTYYLRSSAFSLGCEAYRGFPCSVGATSSTPITVVNDGEQVVADFGLYVDGIFRDRME